MKADKLTQLGSQQARGTGLFPSAGATLWLFVESQNQQTLKEASLQSVGMEGQVRAKLSR